MKTNFLITGETTKYWKKAIKKDRVMVANKDGYIYILNGYNAFKIPAKPFIWDTTPAERLPFCWDAGNCTTQLYSLNNGDVIGVDIKYDSMVDITLAKTIYCKGKFSPVVIADDYFIALLMPVRMGDRFKAQAENAFAKMINKEAQQCI